LETLRYRPEIDGLRAIAVVSVIVYHAGFNVLSGGFVGVDVFFVISGYLITSFILRDMGAGNFSLGRFYERRARRILPALFLVMLVCLPIALMLLMPRHMQDFAESLFAVATFTSNMFFLAESGYFGAEAELKPMLHTWSLAVEEQFYIFFPLLLLLLRPVSKRWLSAIFTLVLLASLIFAERLAVTDPNAAFYLLPTRAWELALGALTAVYLLRVGPRAESPARQFCGILGLGLIVFSAIIYDERTPFPGIYALAPTVGTSLIILFGVNGTWVNAILRQRVLVGVGLLSYSAYLWHQPLFAFARYVNVTSTASSVMGGLCLLTFLLAYCSWRWVETPFRRPGLIKTSQVAIASGGLASLYVSLGVLGYTTSGFKELIFRFRMTPIEIALYENIASTVDYDLYSSMVDNGDCRFWSSSVDHALRTRILSCAAKYGKAVVVIGDSHAMNIYNAFAKSDVLPFLVGISQGNCRPHDNFSYCHYDAFDDFLSKHGESVGTILFHQSGAGKPKISGPVRLLGFSVVD
jgi:peptidoglycan/LPS O-acetylase OafA/YrhL